MVLNPPDAPSIHSAPYCAGPKQRELERGEVDKMREAGAAEHAIAEWASPIVSISKEDGCLHFCVDYRHANAVTERDSYRFR